MTNATQTLRNNNIKATPQRIAVFNAIYSTNKHPNAETIFRYLLPSYPSMSLATVYKTLKTLKECKLIQEINVGEDSFRYDFNITNHSHLICINCKDVSDINNSNWFKIIKEEIRSNTSFTPLYEQVYIYGVCNECSE
jgi:Fur family transcriptional regulator, peroxide stress response regulator